MPPRPTPSHRGTSLPLRPTIPAVSSGSPRAWRSWSGRRGSNPRPTAWKAVTLPLSYSRLRSLAPLRLTHDARGAASPLHSLAAACRDRRCPCLPLPVNPGCSPSVPRTHRRLAARHLRSRDSSSGRARVTRAKAGGEGRIRTFEAAWPTDLQSAAFDRSATSPNDVIRRRTPAGTRNPMLSDSRRLADSIQRSLHNFWSWRRDSNPRPADYKSAALPD